MARLLIVYGTNEGQTRKIAGRIADAARELGHAAEVVDSATSPGLARPHAYDAVVVAGSVHAGRHQASLARFVRRSLAELSRLPTAFFSVSLSATGSDLPGARKCADAFLHQTGWFPSMVRLTPGALMYTRYGFLTRWLMRRIARRAGGDTDTSRDYEYTDWAKLRADVEAFLLRAIPAEAPAAGEPAGAGR
jgi:menaquinone-dependent protoporphyrinogen oxidase